MSPFCDLSQKTGMIKWSKDIEDLYQNISIPEYVASLASPFRQMYPQEKMKEEEVLTSLVKVKNLIIS